MPSTPKQSTRLLVTSYSKFTSCSPSASTASEPIFKSAYAGLLLKIYSPSSGASGYISLLEPSSSIEHIIPNDSTPRSFPFLIRIPPGVFSPLWPPATRPPSSTTGTMAPSNTFGAPVTICTVSPSSLTCTWQITSLSASGWRKTLFTLPTTIFSKSASKHS